MGNIDLLKDIHCSFSLIPVSPFKVKMTWQDKVMAWRAVWGLWGHLFCRPGINSLHMCCCSTICLYSMCRFRRNAFIFCWQRQQPCRTDLKYGCLLVG